jgi:flap endonuclease-1
MGIKNINDILKKYAQNGITRKKISVYKNQIITIDISIYLYRFKYTRVFDENETDDGKKKTFILKIINQILKLLKHNIIPLYIFDGKPSNAKSGTLQHRTKRKNDFKEKIKSLELKMEVCEKNEDGENKKELLLEKISKNKKNIINVKTSDKILCIKLFDLMGIPYLVADGEAEILCARLCQKGFASGCFSQDSDLMPNGAEYFLRDLSNNSSYINEYHLPTILTLLSITYLEFVDMCIMCGCDYVDRIKGIGPINSYKYIKKYHTIENVVKYLSTTKYKKIIPVDYIKKCNKARVLFTEKILDNDFKLNVKLNKPNINELKTFLKNEINLSEETILKINKVLLPKKLKLGKGQKSIKDFF